MRADPWLAPGNEGLRADVQLLADAGILRGPVTTWPMSWPDIARDVLSTDEIGLDEGTANALARLLNALDPDGDQLEIDGNVVIGAFRKDGK